VFVGFVVELPCVLAEPPSPPADAFVPLAEHAFPIAHAVATNAAPFNHIPRVPLVSIAMLLPITAALQTTARILQIEAGW
jgi:hypothetical protein